MAYLLRLNCVSCGNIRIEDPFQRHNVGCCSQIYFFIRVLILPHLFRFIFDYLLKGLYMKEKKVLFIVER